LNQPFSSNSKLHLREVIQLFIAVVDLKEDFFAVGILKLINEIFIILFTLVIRFNMLSNPT